MSIKPFQYPVGSLDIIFICSRIFTYSTHVHQYVFTQYAHTRTDPIAITLPLACHFNLVVCTPGLQALHFPSEYVPLQFWSIANTRWA